MAQNSEQPRDKNGRWTVVGYYIAGTGIDMNRQLRKGDESNPNIEKLDAEIESRGTTYEGELYRGTDERFTQYLANEGGLIEIEDEVDYTDALQGLEVEDLAFMSTTMDRKVATEYMQGGGVPTLIKIKTNEKSLAVEDVMGSDYSFIEERVFPREKTLTINKAYGDYDDNIGYMLTVEATLE